MIVYIDCRLLSDNPTGISRYTEQLIKFYKSSNICSNLVLIVNSNFDKHNSNFKYLVTDLNPFSIFDCVKFSLLINRQKLDLLHSPFYSSTFFNKNFKKVISVMDLMYGIIPNYFSKNYLINFLKVKYFDIIVFLSLRKSSLLISISETTKSDLSTKFNSISETIKLGFTDLDSNMIISEEIYKLKNVDYYFYIGNNRKQKNLDFLIQSFLKSNTNKKLVIAGCVVDKQNNIINFKSVNETELGFLYKSCFCFVFPSLYEGFGIPVIEAISYSCPILLSNAGSLKEFKTFDLNYFNPKNENELINYFNNENLINHGANYNKLTQTYNWNNYFILLENLLKQKILR